MPLWMWLNIPLMVLVIAAVVGIPYWLVLKHPDQDAPTLRRSARPARTPVAVPAQARYEQRVPAVNGQRFGENYSDGYGEAYGQERVLAENDGREYDYSNRRSA